MDVTHGNNYATAQNRGEEEEEENKNGGSLSCAENGTEFFEVRPRVIQLFERRFHSNCELDGHCVMCTSHSIFILCFICGPRV